MLASMAGFVIFAGEFVGGGLAPIIATKIAGGAHGLKGALYFAAIRPRGRLRGGAVPEGNRATQRRR